ncbi:hypothetical protein ACQP3C_28660, partial [Escherichia coli]
SLSFCFLFVEESMTSSQLLALVSIATLTVAMPYSLLWTLSLYCFNSNKPFSPTCFVLCYFIEGTEL